MTASSFFYLHGFASSPQSTKAQELCRQFTARRLPLMVPDFNGEDFTQLTLTRQIQQVKSLLPTTRSVTLIGSSFGGLTAAWLAENCPQVERLVLLAPAFQFLNAWIPKIGQAQFQKWRSGEPLLVYHHREKRLVPLDYAFVTDFAQYNEAQLQKPVPTLIIHGLYDDVIPIEASRTYTATRPWAQLMELDSGHALTDQIDTLWQAIVQFCCL